VMSPAGAVVDTVQLGAQSSGMQDFSWTPPSGVNASAGPFKFRITASNGGTAVPSTTYAQDKVTAVSTAGGKLQLDLQNLGLVDFSTVQQLN